VSNEPEVLVVGAGVSGLTTAVCLAEAGLKVKIQARGTDESTTSYAAGATWSPYLVESSERARAWSFETLDVLRDLAAQPGTGVVLRRGVTAADEPPEWHARLDGFQLLDPDQVPDGLAAGWRVVAPVLDMPAYLRYLRRRAEAAGVQIEVRRLASLAEAGRNSSARADSAAPVVVNCTGIGARELVGDPGVIPVRGQIVVVENPGITEFLVVEGDPVTYFFPQGGTVILGGTAEVGDDNTEPDPDTAKAIVERCVRLEPLLAGARIVGHRVGLRPTRSTVRLEREGRVIHNYGHGGAGITISWACARQVTAMLVPTADRGSPS
jgi:D-amino-acid oxidase